MPRHVAPPQFCLSFLCREVLPCSINQPPKNFFVQTRREISLAEKLSANAGCLVTLPRRNFVYRLLYLRVLPCSINQPPKNFFVQTRREISLAEKLSANAGCLVTLPRRNFVYRLLYLRVLPCSINQPPKNFFVQTRRRVATIEKSERVSWMQRHVALQKFFLKKILQHLLTPRNKKGARRLPTNFLFV